MPDILTPDTPESNPANPTPLKRTRAEANRANAQKSTGPRTPEGKKKASLNALRHGITAQVTIMTEEDMAAYKVFTARFHNHFKPADPVEEQLVQTLADSQWRLNRYRSIENTILAIAFEKRSDIWLVENPNVHGAFATADGYSYKTQDLATLGIQEQRVFKQYNQTFDRLTAIQAARAKREEIDMCNAANLYAMHQAENPPSKDPEVPVPQYVPALDGFVLQIPEIVLYSTRKARLSQSRGYEEKRLTSNANGA